MKFIGRIVEIFSGAKLACALIIYSVFFIFLATLESRSLGIAAVQGRYFESWFCAFNVLPIWALGGKSVGAIAALNLFFCITKRLKKNRKSAAFLLAHAGLAALVISGFLQGFSRVEGAMALREGEPSNMVLCGAGENFGGKKIALPFSVELVKFERKTWLNTEIPSEFSSRVRFISGESREEKVLGMNDPASFRGWTFYQMSYAEGGRVSVLQAVKNPYSWLPEISVAAAFFGMVLMYAFRLKTGGAK